MKTVETAGASLRVLKNEGEMRRFMERAQKATPKVQPVQISLRGPDLSKDDRERLEAEIQQIVTTEFNQAQHRIRLEREQHRRQDERAITISLKGLPLPDHDIRLIESKVEQGITTILPRELRGQEIVVCGCGWPFGGCCDPPGLNIPLNSLGWPPPWPPDRPYFIAVFMPPGTHRVQDVEDVLLWKVENGASHNLTPDQMLVGLTTSVDWAKEIAAWQTCTCEIAKVHQDGHGQSPVWMFLTRDQTDTIVFKKPKTFLAIWTDMYHIEPTEFWPYLGGKIMTVYWISDDYVTGMGVNIHLRANNGQYVCAEGGGGGPVVANRGMAKEWETFDLVDQNEPLRSGDQVSLTANNGQLVCAEGGGGREVVANRNEKGPWETFVIQHADGSGGEITNGQQIALIANNGQFVCAEGGGGREVVANRNAIGPWETFWIEIL